MSSEHKKPLLAFAIIAVACGLFMGYTVRANALMGDFAQAVNPITVVAKAVHLAPAAPSRAVDSEAGSSESDQGPERDTSTKPHASVEAPRDAKTADPVARPGFGKHKGVHKTRAANVKERGKVNQRTSHRLRRAVAQRGLHQQRRMERRAARRSEPVHQTRHENRTRHEHRRSSRPEHRTRHDHRRSSRPEHSYSNRSHRSHGNRHHRSHNRHHRSHGHRR